MKKNIVLLLMIALSALHVNSQANWTDDGMVSSRLSVNVQENEYKSFMDGLTGGLLKVINKELTTVDEVSNYYGIDISTFPTLNDWFTMSKEKYAANISNGFLEKLTGAIDKTGSDFTDVFQFRNALAEMANSSTLSENEKKALVLIDLSTQKIAKDYAFDELYALVPTFKHRSSGTNLISKKTPASSEMDVKIPKWLRCGLGTVGSAVLGGLSGVSVGIRVGGQVGGAVGGVIGVIAGTFTGVSKYCD